MCKKVGLLYRYFIPHSFLCLQKNVLLSLEKTLLQSFFCLKTEALHSKMLYTCRQTPSIGGPEVGLHLLDEFCELVGHLHPVLTGGDEGRQQQPGLAGVRGIFDEGRLQRLQ